MLPNQDHDDDAYFRDTHTVPDPYNDESRPAPPETNDPYNDHPCFMPTLTPR